MIIGPEAAKTRFSIEPYEPLTIQVGGEAFDLRSLSPFLRWHHAALNMDCFGVRLDGGRLIDLRVVTESSVTDIYGTKYGYYTANVISAEEATRLQEAWATAEF